ncbi:MAG: hypothetical protein E2O92_09255 [Alphaproteobacteria bacterium]|nr:MAG: hypothetical protein E2O92_09255 [Alphaproteobacteria bacterium]
MTDQPTIMQLATRPKVVRSSVVVAIVVGTILNLINQGDALLGDQPLVIWKLVLTYMVPYCVSTYGAVMALRNTD